MRSAIRILKVIRYCVSIALAVMLIYVTPAWAGERRALLIGINKYANVTQLNNAVPDAERMKQVLDTLGYKTTLVPESKTNRVDLLQEFGKFAQQLNEGDDAVVFYAGHGVEVAGANYLVPKDAPSPDDIILDSNLPDYLLSFSRLVEQIKRRDVNGNIWILDACRNNPFERPGRAMGGTNGLSGSYGPAGTFLFYSAEANRKALDRLPTDGPAERNGLYVRAFASMVLQRRSDDVRLLAQAARVRVRDLTNGFQRPSYYDSLDTAWCFSPCQQVSSTTLQTPLTTIVEPTAREITAAINQTAPNSTSSALTQPNVVMLGKKSAVGDCVNRSPDSAPFGCDVLRTAAVPTDSQKTSAQTRVELFGRELRPVTDVNVRLRAPTVIEKQGAIYSCVVRVISEQDSIRLSGIIDVNVGGETFYWGTIDGPPENCRPRQSSRDSIAVGADKGVRR
ncbi:MAG: caspase family protein [Pseudomonadota bacterium]